MSTDWLKQLLEAAVPPEALAAHEETIKAALAMRDKQRVETIATTVYPHVMREVTTRSGAVDAEQMRMAARVSVEAARILIVELDK